MSSNEFYVDVMEGEVNQEELHRWERLRQELKKADDVAIPESGHYFDALESRIMMNLDAAIELGEVRERGKAVESTRPRIRRELKARLSSAMVIAAVVILSAAHSVKTRTGDVARVDVPAELDTRARAASKVLTDSVIGFQAAADLAVEIAARRLVAFQDQSTIEPREARSYP